jgi:hypothetical protein
MRLLPSPLAIFLAATAVLTVTAQPQSDGKSTAKKIVTPMAEENFGRITLGGKFAEDLQSLSLDWLGGGYVAPNTALFVNVRGTFDDQSQQLFSAGIGIRHLFENPGIIVGANAYYDYVDSQFGNGINQFGFGAEILTKWVDARFNYYLPENDRHLVREFNVVSTDRSTGPEFANGNMLQRNLTTSTTVSTFGIFEQGLEGWNAEAGFRGRLQLSGSQWRRYRGLPRTCRSACDGWRDARFGILGG